MATNVVLGPDAKVDVGPDLIPFRVLGGRIRDTADVNETTDSESPYESKECHPRGLQQLTIELEMQFDTEDADATVGIYIAPFSLAVGNRIPMNIWPEGREVNNSNWAMPSVVVQSVSPGFMVRGSQPQGGTVSVMTSGYYKRPYENSLLDIDPDDVYIRTR